MARISELHYSNALAKNSGVSEFLEASLGASEDPADFTVSFYEANGTVGIEIPLDHPDVQVTVDPDNGEVNYVISADDFPLFLTDPDGGGSNNYEAYALTNTADGTVIDFYDIGGGSTNIVAQDGLAAGEMSENVPVLVGPNATTTTLQWNQPNPDQLTYGTLSPGDTGLACFVSGTLVDTAQGARPIERVQPGDLVQTVDRGLQPVRWCGKRRVTGLGLTAPVCVRAGALGATQDLLLSPQHRVLLSGWKAQLLFGADELLVPVQALIDDHSICRAPRATVTYVHLLFDQHELVTTQGLVSESLLPGPHALSAWDAAARAEIVMLFPELSQPVGWPAARMIEQDRRTALLA